MEADSSSWLSTKSISKEFCKSVWAGAKFLSLIYNDIPDLKVNSPSLFIISTGEGIISFSVDKFFWAHDIKADTLIANKKDWRDIFILLNFGLLTLSVRIHHAWFFLMMQRNEKQARSMSRLLPKKREVLKCHKNIITTNLPSFTLLIIN